MSDKKKPLEIVRSAELSEETTVNLHADGSLTLEVFVGADLALVLLSKDEVRELLRFLAAPAR